MTATAINSAVTMPSILLLFDSQRFEHCIFRAVIEDEIEAADQFQWYKCNCGKTFLPTPGTIFDEHRISISMLHSHLLCWLMGEW